MNTASFTPNPIVMATAESITMSGGISDSLISAKSKLPMVRPIIRKPSNKTTAPAWVQNRNIMPIFLLGPSPQRATRKKPGMSMTSKKI